MQSSLRRFIEMLDVRAMAAGCHRTMGIEEELFKDAIVGVLAALLRREEVFAEKFPTANHCFAYVRKAAVREALRMQQQRQRHQAISEEFSVVRTEETPESQLLAHEARWHAKQEVGGLREAARKGLETMGKSKETIRHCEVLLGLLLAEPERHLTRRMSGKEKGALVVDQASLVAATGWDKRRVSERLRWLQRALRTTGWEVS